MRKIRLGLISLLLAVGVYSCDLLEEAANGISDGEIVEGLKKALEVGADSAATGLSQRDGYLKDEVVKIWLPKEAQAVHDIIKENSTINSIANTVGLNSAFDKVIESVNRAAESAATEAAPEFGKAIKNMSFSDAISILNGQSPNPTKSTADFDSTAATQYFKIHTTEGLTAIYAPKINTALGENLGVGVSATEAWKSLTSLYNKFFSRTDVTLALSLSGIDLPSEINDDLGEFCTEKALDGLFYYVGEEEKKIRKNPYEWALDILHKVFGD